jgi:hypothetical protein
MQYWNIPHIQPTSTKKYLHNLWTILNLFTSPKLQTTDFNPFTASCENAMILSVPGIPASCEKFPHSSQLNIWSSESIVNV